MKATLKLIFPLLAVFAISAVTLSCDEDSKDVSFITYYVNIDLKGDNPMGVPVGGTYTEPGYTATEKGEDVTDTVVESGASNIDTSEKGYAVVTYSATNSDGYDIAVRREVLITGDYNEDADIEGNYQAELVRDNDGTVLADENQYKVTITKVPNVDGVYEISDLLGGWYDQRAGYGSGYAGRGYIQVDPDNSIFIYHSLIQGWGSSVINQPDNPSEYDPATGVIQLNVIMDDNPKMLFFVTLTPGEGE